MNNVIIAGNLGRDAEVTETSSGKQVAEFSVATRSWGKDAPADWHRVKFWEPKGTVTYLTKGARVVIQGSLKTDEWEDKDGKKRYKTFVLARDVELFGGRDDNKPAARPAARPAPKQVAPPPAPPADDDQDVPF